MAGRLLAAALVAAAIPGAAHGQSWSDFYWDANGTAAGTGGTGTWDTTDSLWRSGSSTGTLGAWVNTGDNRARFEGTAGTVTIADGVTIQAGGIVFNTADYVIDRAGTGALELLPGATAPVPTITTLSSATIAVPISGTAGFIKAGTATATLTLSGSSTYSGTTAVTAGILQVAAPFALGATGVGNEVTVANTARLELADGVTVSGKSVSIIGQGGSDSSGALRAASGTATWAGDVLIPTSGLSGAPRIGAGAVGATLEVSGVISGGMSEHGVAFRPFTPSGSRELGDGGRVVVSGENTYVGPTDVVAGALSLAGGDDRLPTGSVLRIGNASNLFWASFDLAGHNQRVAGLESVGGGTGMPRVVTNSAGTASTLTVGRDADEAFSFIGTLTGNLALVKTGSNRLALTISGTGPGWASTFSGGTRLEGGVLRIGSSTGAVGAIDSSPIGTGTLALAGGRLTSSGSTDRTILNAVTLEGDVALGDTTSGVTGGLQFLAPTTLTASPTLTIDSPVEFAGAIGEATAGLGLVKQGSATLTLSAANTLTGTTSLLSGTLAIGNGTANGTVLGPIDTAAATTVLFTTIASSSQTHAAVISGEGGLVKAGGGTLTLSGANDYSGGTTVSAGALVFDGTAAIGGSGANVVIAAGATAGLATGPLSGLLDRVDAASTGALGLTSSSADAIDLSGFGSLRLAAIGDVTYSGVLTPSGTTYRLGGTRGLLTLDQAGQLTGSRDVVISGSVAYAATMNYSGPTTVAGGTLAFTGDDRLPSGAAVTLGNGAAGVLDLRGTTQTLASLATVGSGNSVGNSSTTADATLAFDPGAGVSTTYAGGIVDAIGGGTRTTGVAIRSGTVVFTGASAYSGDTLVAGGATLELARTDTYTFGSEVTGAGGIRFTGGLSNQPILSGQSTYSGGSELAGANVRLGVSSTVAGGEIVSGPLGTGTVTFSSGNLSSGTTDSVTLANPVVFGGNVGVGSSVAQFTGPLELSGSATLTGSRTLTVNSPVVISGPIGESGGSHGLTKSGDGLLTLSGQSTYSGTTTVSSGTLLLAGGADRLPAGRLVVNGATAVLDLGGQSQSVAENLTVAGNGRIINGTLTTPAANFAPGAGTGEISASLTGDVGLIKNTTNVLTLSGQNLYTGTTTVSSGVLRVTDGLALGGTAAGTIVGSGGRLELAGGVVVTGESLEIAGSGGDIFFGALQSQSGDNTWAGPVVLSVASTRIGGLLDTTLRVSGPISGTGPLILRPEGDVTSTAVIELSGANSYSGGTVVYAGTLRLAGGDDRLPTTGGLTIGLSGNNLYGSVDLGGVNQTVAGLSSLGNNQALQVIGNSSTSADSTLRVNLGSGTSTTFAGQLVDTIGAGTRTFALTKAGGGTLVLTGTQNTFSGDTLLEGGVLRITNGLALQNSTLHTGSGSAGTIQFSGFTSGTLGGLRGANNLVLSNTAGAALALTVGGNGRSTVFSGGLSGGGSLTKTGTGSLTLAGLNTYAGATQIDAGRLLLTGTLGGSGVSVASGAVLGGTGLVSAPTTIAAGGILAPGASTGTIEFNNGLTWGGGGVLQFEINDATGTAGSVTNGWDLVDVTAGSFAITATSGNPFTIQMITLTAAQEPGLADNFDNAIDRAWLLLQHTTEIGGFDADAFQFTTGGFQNPLFPGAGFGLFRGDSSVVQGLVSGATNQQLYVVYSVPEPTGLILAGMGLVTVAALARRRAVARKRA